MIKRERRIEGKKWREARRSSMLYSLHLSLPFSSTYIYIYIYIYIYTSFLGLFPSGSIIIPGELIRALPGDRRHEERTWRIKCWEEEEEEEFKAANLNRALLFFSTGQSLGAIKQKLTVSTGVNETRKGCGGMAATERGGERRFEDRISGQR